jgi:cardiolipin synthase (CMP-forming)
LRWLPDLLTGLRLLAAPALAWLILAGRFRDALLLVVFAGLTDWLDGFAARRLGSGSQLGVVLDPVADKVLLVTAFVVLPVVGLIPVWLLVLVLGRDVVIVLGALVLRAWRGHRTFLPSLLGKISTFFQIMLVLHVMLYAVFPNELFFLLKSAAVALTTIFTALSGADYIRSGWHIAAGPSRQPPQT